MYSFTISIFVWFFSLYHMLLLIFDTADNENSSAKIHLGFFKNIFSLCIFWKGVLTFCILSIILWVLRYYYLMFPITSCSLLHAILISFLNYCIPGNPLYYSFHYILHSILQLSYFYFWPFFLPCSLPIPGFSFP